jgi:hypothetical protein
MKNLGKKHAYKPKGWMNDMHMALAFTNIPNKLLTLEKHIPC